MPPIFTRAVDPLPHNIHDHLILMTARTTCEKHISTENTSFLYTKTAKPQKMYTSYVLLEQCQPGENHVGPTVRCLWHQEPVANHSKQRLEGHGSTVILKQFIYLA
jgi:hypothetical protein